MDKETSKKADALTRKIYRNKMKIRQHIVMAVFVLLFGAYFFIRNDNEVIDTVGGEAYLLIIGLLIISDIFFIFYHKWWINKRRKQLTELTGIDYTKLNNTNEQESDLTYKQYINFMNGLLPQETDVINKAKNNEKLGLIEKGLLISVNAKFDLHCQNSGIICSEKIEKIETSNLK